MGFCLTGNRFPDGRDGQILERDHIRVGGNFSELLLRIDCPDVNEIPFLFPFQYSRILDEAVLDVEEIEAARETEHPKGVRADEQAKGEGGAFHTNQSAGIKGDHGEF